MSETISIVGKAFGRRATVRVTVDAVHWKGRADAGAYRKGDVVIPRSAVTGFAASEQRVTSRLVWGAIFLILALSWFIESEGVPAPFGIVSAGIAALFFLGWYYRPGLRLTIEADGTRLGLDCRSSSVAACRKAVAQFPSEVQTGVGPEFGFVRDCIEQFGVLRMPRDALADEYRAAAEQTNEIPTVLTLDRYVSARRRVALWNMFWGVVAPGAITGVFLWRRVLPELSSELSSVSGWVGVAFASWFVFVLVGVACTLFQRLLLPLVFQWLASDLPIQRAD